MPRGRIIINGRSYPRFAPYVLFVRVRHRLFGPLMGCSCSTRCFGSRWRIEYPARDGYRDRIRIAELERAVDRLHTTLYGRRVPYTPK